MSRILVSLCWSVLLLSCHDAPRNNPFDPALTPPVELQVALDDTAGTATLTWSRYEGKQPFREYRVLRNIAERTRVDTLAHIPTAAQTAFVDTSLAPNTAYVYRVETLNAGGYAAASQEKGVAGFRVGAVQLLGVETNAYTGTVLLRWHRYVGPDFGGYQVFRRVGETIQEELLATRKEVQDTTLVDTTAQADVGYVYRVVVQAASRELPSNSVESRLLLAPVSLSTPKFDSRTASATLNWTQYQGSRFKAYRVERRSAGLPPLVVKEIVDPTATAYVDTALAGNTEYFYQVVVETKRNEEVFSEAQSGAFHQFLAQWPLEIKKGEYVRLYRERAGITALVAGAFRVRLLFYGSGGPVGEQVLWNTQEISIEPRAATTYLSLDGLRVLSLAAGDDLYLVHFGPEGGPAWMEYPVFVDSLRILTGEERRMKGQIQLFGRATFDDVLVTSRGEALFADDFEGGKQKEEWSSLVLAEVVNGQMSIFFGGSASTEEASWQDFRLEATQTFSNPFGTVGIVIGDNLSATSTFSSFSLSLGSGMNITQLKWQFRPSESSGLRDDGRSFTAPFPVLLTLPYRLRLEFVEGKVSASVKSPISWPEPGTRDLNSPWACLAGLEEELVLVSGSQPYRVRLAETDAEPIRSTLDPPPSEMRIWERQSTGNALQWIGICVPEQQRVFTGKTGVSGTPGKILWPFAGLASATALGAKLGQEPGDFIFPLSFDGSADGRIYVLDAGNARIQVFDTEGKHLTQWGRKGSGEGEFDFGSGRAVEDFAGSVAVDDQGFIYVADVGNKRIQKFAP